MPGWQGFGLEPRVSATRNGKGTFYPPDLPDREMLAFYASRFRAVEIDSTFYRMPSQKTLEAWRASTPEDFRFTLKATQQITHRQRLQVPSDSLTYFTSLVPSLGTRLGLVLYQLPPFFKCDTARLRAFLEVLPPEIPACFEFRHPSWFVPEVYALLESRRVVLCINDSVEGCSPMEITAWRHICPSQARRLYGRATRRVENALERLGPGGDRSLRLYQTQRQSRRAADCPGLCQRLLSF